MGVFLVILFFLAATAASFFIGHTLGRKANVWRDSRGRPLPPPARIYDEGYRAGFARAAAGPPPPDPRQPGPAPVPPAPVPPAPVLPVVPPAQTQPAGVVAPARSTGTGASPVPAGTPAAVPVASTGTDASVRPAAGTPAAASTASLPDGAASIPAGAPATGLGAANRSEAVPMASAPAGAAAPVSAQRAVAGAGTQETAAGAGMAGSAPVATTAGADGGKGPLHGVPAPWQAVPARPARPAKSPAQLQEEKRRRDLRNINITLYSASLLLVAAAALFIGLAIPAQARFSGVVALAALFYSSGLVIHARSRRLRPAAVAFTGTGLALIPVVGLALHNFVLHDAPAAWLVTSLLGTAAFAFAAAKIESRVVTYLALTFLLSSGLASGAALRSGIVWYFLFTVVLATLISLAAFRRPRWLNSLYLDAFVQSHRYLVPATALAAVQISNRLSAAELAVLFLGFALYYAVMLWRGPARNQLVNSYGLRAAGTVGLTAMFYSLTDNTMVTLLVFAAQLAVQTAGVLLRRPVYGAAALLQVASRTTGLPLEAQWEEPVPADANRRVRQAEVRAGEGSDAGNAGPRESLPAGPDASGAIAGGPVPGGLRGRGLSLAKVPAVPERKAARFFRTDVALLLALQAGTGLVAGLQQGLAARTDDGSAVTFAATILVVLLTYLAAAWKLRHFAECLAPVPLALGFVPAVLVPGESLWPAVLLTAVLTAYFAVRAATGKSALGFVLAARAGAVLLVPVTILALRPGDGSGPAWALAGAVLALAVNQAVSVVRVRAGKAEQWAGQAIGTAATLAAVLTLALHLHTDSVHLQLVAASVWAVVAANLLTSVLLPRGRYLIAGPAGLASGAALGGGVLGIAGYELLTAVSIGYCAAMVWKLAPPRHRSCYFAAGQVHISILTVLLAADLGLTVHSVFVALAVSLALQHLARVLFGTWLAGLGPATVFTWATLLALAAATPAYYLLTDRAARSETGVALLVIAAVSAALEQCVSGLGAFGRGRSGSRGPSTGAWEFRSAAGASALVLLLCIGVRIAGGGDGAAAMGVLWGALAMNLMGALLRPGTRFEWMAPAGFAATALLGAGLLGVPGYEMLTVVALGYCTYRVVRRATACRGVYLLAAQALAVVLAGLAAADLTGSTHSVFAAVAVGIGAAQLLRTVFDKRLEPLGLADHARWGSLAAAAGVPLVYTGVMGADASPGTQLFLVVTAGAVAVLTQAAALTGLGRARQLPGGLIAAAALTAALSVPASAGIGAAGTGWALGLLWAGVAANTATSLRFPERLEAAAPAGFGAAAALGATVLGLRGYELLTVAALAYCVYMVLKQGQVLRGLYLLGVQGLLVILVVLVAADLGYGQHGLFVAASAALAVQQLIRTLSYGRLDALGYSLSSQWLSLVLLALLPVYYGLLAGAETRRDAVALQLVLLLGTAMSGFARLRRTRELRVEWLLYPAAGAVLVLLPVLSPLAGFGSAGVLASPVVGTGTAGALLLLLAVAALYGETRRGGSPETRTVLSSISAVFMLTALVMAVATRDPALLSAVAAAFAAFFLVLSFTRRLPWLASPLPLLLLAAMSFLDNVFSGPGSGFEAFPALRPAWAAAAMLLILGVVLPPRRKLPGEGRGEDRQTEPRAAADGRLRSTILVSGASLILALYATAALVPEATATAGALTLVAALALALTQVPAGSREPAGQAAVLIAALAVQRVGWAVVGQVDGFWSVQYWACVFAGLAAFDFLRNRPQRGTLLLSVSATVLSTSGLFTVITGGGGRQLWALVAHAGLLAFGLLASRRLFTLWGAAGVALAVLWYLRGYTFLLLALLGIGLIALAVWRLTRVRPEGQNGRSPRGAAAPPPPPPPPPTVQGTARRTDGMQGQPSVPTNTQEWG